MSKASRNKLTLEYKFLSFTPYIEPLDSTKSLIDSDAKIFISLENIQKYDFMINEYIFIILLKHHDGNELLPSTITFGKISPLSGLSADGDVAGYWGQKVLLIPLWVRLSFPFSSQRTYLKWKGIDLNEIKENEKILQNLAEDKLKKAEYLYPSLCVCILYKNHPLTVEIIAVNECDKNHIAIKQENFFKRAIEAIQKFPLFYAHKETKFIWLPTDVAYERDFNINQVKESTINLFGGMDQQILELLNILNSSLTNIQHSLYPKGILIHGNSGTAKTHLLHHVCDAFQRTGVFVKRLSALQFISILDEISILPKLVSIFNEAIKNSPSLVFMDDFDLFFSKTGSSKISPENNDNKMIHLFEHVFNSVSTPVVIIAVTNQCFHLSERLKSFNMFDYEIEIPSPRNYKEREIILKKIVQREAYAFSLSDTEWKEIALRTHGYIGRDLYHLVQSAYEQSKSHPDNRTEDFNDEAELLLQKLDSFCLKDGSSSIKTRYDHIVKALKLVKPSLISEWSIEVPNVKWEDIGGQHLTKQKLKEAVEWPLLYPERFTKMGIEPPKGILLYGPPGNSKTLLAKALATESRLNFLAVKGPQLLNKWVGESEKSLREVFRKARAAAPSILFFDEIDAIAGKRGSDGSNSSSGVGDRLLTQLLTELDGIQPLLKVVFIAATNRPDVLDAALIRPGRIDRLIYTGMPDLETRNEILSIQFKKMPFDHVDTLMIAEKTEGYSGAELVALCQHAGILAMEEDMNTSRITERHLFTALSEVKPRTDPTLLNYYIHFQKKHRC